MNRRQFLSIVASVASASLLSPLELLAQEEYSSVADYDKKADYYHSRKEYDNVIRVCNEGLAKFPNAWELYVGMSTAYLGKGDNRASKISALKIIPLARDNTDALKDAYHNLVIVCYNLREIRECKKYIKMGKALDPKDIIYASAEKRIERFFSDK